MGASSALGYVFKFMAEARKSKDDALRRLVAAHTASSESADAAASRTSGGTWVRRFLVVSVVLAVIGFPFISAFFGVTTFVEITHLSREWLFGLVGGYERTDFHPVDGYLLVEENRTILLALSSFYFGQAAGK